MKAPTGRLATVSAYNFTAAYNAPIDVAFC
jgi:hypothetical protein